MIAGLGAEYEDPKSLAFIQDRGSSQENNINGARQEGEVGKKSLAVVEQTSSLYSKTNYVNLSRCYVFKTLLMFWARSM
jgi:hypothetical protein